MLCLPGSPQGPSQYPRLIAFALESVEGCEGCGRTTQDVSESPERGEKDPYPSPEQIPTFADTAAWLKGLWAQGEQDKVELDVEED